MADETQTETPATDEHDVEVEITITGDTADQPARYNVNGEEGEVPRNSPVRLPLRIVHILVEAGYPVELTESLPEAGPAADGAETGAVPAASGDGGVLAHGGASAAVIAEPAPVELEGNAKDTIAKVEEIAAAVPFDENGKKPVLEGLLAAEKAGKNRSTVIAAIEAALVPPQA